jgi:MFS family permease
MAHPVSIVKRVGRCNLSTRWNDVRARLDRARLTVAARTRNRAGPTDDGQIVRETSTRPYAVPARWPILRNIDFLLLWSGQTVSVLGNQVSSIALPLLVLALTGSAAQAGAVSAVRLLPYTVLFLPAGAMIDRWNRRVVMMLADSMRGAALGAVPIAFFSGHLAIWLLYTAVLAEGTGFVFYTIAQIASLPRIVATEQLAPATAMNEGSQSFGTLVGPGLGGLIVSLGRTVVSGAIVGLGVDAVSYFASVLSLAFIRTSFQADRGAATATPLLQQIRSGLVFLLGHPHLRVLALLGANIGLFIIPADLAAIVLSRGELHLSAQVIGLIFSAGGLGALIGSAFAPWFKRRFKLSHVTYLAVIVEGLAVAAMAVTSSAVVLGAGMLVETMMIPIYNVSQATYRLRLIPDKLQGRVNSVIRLFPIASQPAGVAAAGVLIGVIGPRPVLAVIAAGLVASALLVRFTSLRNV